MRRACLLARGDEKTAMMDGGEEPFADPASADHSASRDGEYSTWSLVVTMSGFAVLLKQRLLSIRR